MDKVQLIGALIEAGCFVAFGVFIQFFLAGYVKKRIAQGKEKPEMAERIKKNGRWAGWFWMLFGVLLFLVRVFH